MASPNYDALHVSLSKMMGDPVAAAATDGKVWTSVLRDVLLNNAIRRWIRLQATSKPPNYNALKGYINVEGKSLTNNALVLSSWTGGVAFILSASNSTDNVIVRRLPDGWDSIATAGTNVYYLPSTTNQFWKQEGSTFRLLDGGTTTADTIRLEYVKQHTALTQANATDILVSAEYWDEILDLAYKISREEKATEMQVALAKEQIVLSEIANAGSISNQ